MSFKLFYDIKELVTLKGAAKKDARRVEEKDLSVLKNAAMLTYRGNVLWVGKNSLINQSFIKKIIKKNNLNLKINQLRECDLKNKTVLPGFVESHTHLVFSGDRSHEFELRNQGVSYQEIAKKGGGIKSTMKSVRKSSPIELLKLAQKRVDSFTKQGVTTLEIKSGYALDKKNEVKMLKVIQSLVGPKIISTYLGAHAVPPEFDSSKKYLDFIKKEMLPLIKKQSLANRVDMFIEKGYFSKMEAKSYYELAEELGFQLAAHTEQLSRSGGYEVLLGGAHSVDHMIELSKTDILKVAKSNLTSVLLPGADYYLKTPYPKARDLIDAGARVALATDFNPGSCPTQDISFIGNLARLEMKMKLHEVIAAYTIGGAHALGLQNEVGSLEAGKKADFVTFHDSWKSLFYQVGYHPIHQTYRNAKKIS